MRFSRPATGTVLGAIALFVALGGTALAGATVVNIADPTTPANVAKVDATDKLQISGSVTNTVNTELAAPVTTQHHHPEPGQRRGLRRTRDPAVGEGDGRA
jgi:hypothetical protein